MNLYLAFFRSSGHGQHHAVIRAKTFDAARNKTLSLRNEKCPICSCDTIVFVDEDGINPRATGLLERDFPAKGYLGTFEAESRPPRWEIIVEQEPISVARQPDHIRQQLAGYNVISIREIE